MPTVFGDWLKTERKKKHLTQDQLSEISDLTKAQISRVESGIQGTKRPTAVRLAEALGADPREALEALMADTPGLEPVVVVERVPTDDAEFWDAYEGAPQEDRELAKLLLQRARERERARTIGGTIAE